MTVAIVRPLVGVRHFCWKTSWTALCHPLLRCPIQHCGSGGRERRAACCWGHPAISRVRASLHIHVISTATDVWPTPARSWEIAGDLSTRTALRRFSRPRTGSVSTNRRRCDRQCWPMRARHCSQSSWTAGRRITGIAGAPDRVEFVDTTHHIAPCACEHGYRIPGRGAAYGSGSPSAETGD